MKDEEKIRDQLNKSLYNYFLDEYKDKLSCKPKNCVHNYRHKEGGEEVGLCMLGADNPEEWPGNICDDVSTAKQCPFFDSKYDKAFLEEKFLSKIKDEGTLKECYKDVYALKWALNDKEDLDPTFSFWQLFMVEILSILVKFQLWFRV